MRRLLLAAVLASLSFVTALNVAAAPQVQEVRPVIAQPEPDAVVRGVVQIVGTATHPQFLRYELYYAPWPVPSDNAWIFIGPDAHFQQQPLGLLGTWDSRSVPDGVYALRVRVVKVDSNYHDSEPRKITVANTRPPDTPTPAPTETPIETPVPTEMPTLEPSPTILVELPVGKAGTPAPAQTPVEGATPVPTAATREPSPILGSSGGEAGAGADGGSASMGEIISGDRLLSAARTGALYAMVAFVALGLFFGSKALLVWLWHRMRPEPV